MKKTAKKRGWAVFLISVAILFILLRVALYDGLTVSEYEISSDKVSASHTYVIVTDLHSTYYGEDQEKLASEIGKYSPEAVFLVGDISEDRRDFDGTAAFLERVANEYPCYYVTGNHERWVEYTNDIRGLFESYGVTVLSGDTVELGDGITLHGVDDPLFYPTDEDFYDALVSLPTSDQKLDILLSHRPEYAKTYASLGFDMTLCGHAHGGQVRIPFTKIGVYAPHQGFFPEYTAGKYGFGENTVIVSRGLMIDDLPRVFNPPEIIVLTISPK